MKELKNTMEDAGYHHVITYIQSGNIVFKSAQSNVSSLEKELEKKILSKFGFDVPVVIRNAAELKAVINENPFTKEKAVDEAKLYFTLLASTPTKENIAKTNEFNYEPDKFHIADSVVYIYCENGYGNTKLNNNFFENKLKVVGTTRNLNTLNKLIELAEEK